MSAPTGYTLVFADEFDTLSLSNGRTATANWYTGQPWGGGFGEAAFIGAGAANAPFSSVVQGGETALRIEMTRNAAGRLESGLISNTFPDGSSRTPQDGDPYGYYEARLWLPTGQGIWPAFWSIEAERLSASRDHVVEIDVMEHYGTAMPDRFTAHLHDWNWDGGTLAGHDSDFARAVAGPNVLATGWHTYGVEVRPDTTTFYFDDKPFWSVETPAALDSDPMLMVNLAAGGGWPVSPKLDDVSLYVDYVRAYELKPSSAPTAPAPAAPLPAAPSPTEPVAAPTKLLVGTAKGDTFTVSDSATQISEAADGGTDTVRASVSYILPDHVDRLVLTGTGPLSGTGNGLANEIQGNAGANTLSGLGGNDVLNGGGGNDLLLGGEGNDKLHGDAGNDVLIGGLGTDRLYGEAGADTFRFTALADSPYAARDTIVDFDAAEGDTIDLSAIDANSLVAGDQAFTYIGAAAFSAAGQLRYANGILSGDLNGDRIADFGLTLTVSALHHGDIVL
ncbi:family 16 glycosylhydrolase [Methylobacterium durans]|uniref:family 16 glycosylhydrolase n=1 Tax=Methylobacterium durans TaxID=2202825 RepID=UPI002AFFB60C|nr:family 16 glycosylhydrolase [Methylobacterium durans]MEA1832114.1 family 16 glycosylhydrolase [Methylobacterium durans]